MTILDARYNYTSRIAYDQNNSRDFTKKEEY